MISEVMDDRPGLIEVFMDAVRNNDAHKERVLEKAAQKQRAQEKSQAEAAKKQEFQNTLEAHPKYKEFENNIKMNVEGLSYALAKSNAVPRVCGERIIGSGYKIEDGNIRFGLAGVQYGGARQNLF